MASIPLTQPINFKYPFQYASKGAFATNDTTVDAVADDLKILLKTNWGERMIHYDFGANLRALLFEPTPDMQQQISNQITNAVEKWMPFVNIDDITVTFADEDASVDYNSVYIQIQFSIGDTSLKGTTSVSIS